MHLHSPEVVPAVVTSAVPHHHHPSLSPTLTNVYLSPSTMRFLSASHLFIASFVVGLQIVATCIAETQSDSNSVDRIYSSSSTGAGIWCGVFFGGTGVVGWMTARKKSNCYLITFLILSILCVIPFCTIECAAASHDLAERYYLFCNHRFSSLPPGGSAVVVPCSRYYGSMVCLNALLLVATLLELSVAVTSVVLASKALHRGRGCLCCCGSCYGAADTATASSSLTPPPQSFVIYTRGNLIAGDQSPPMITSMTTTTSAAAGAASVTASAPHTVLALSPNGVHPQYFSFHAPDSSETPYDLTGARYTANGISDSSLTPETTPNGRLVCSRSPPPSYEESIKR